MKKMMIAALFMLGAVAANAQMKHQLPVLPYAKDALAPVMSQETIEFHHGKHVQAYVDKLNELIPGTDFANATLEDITMRSDGAIFNNGAQILNHIIFFDTFAAEANAKKIPTGDLASAINRDFGSLQAFKDAFDKAAAGVFGSGWTWLAADKDGRLSIISLSNAGNPLRDGYKPLWGVDVWEHSYYIDYRNARADYLKNLWRIVDWNVIEKRYAELK